MWFCFVAVFRYLCRRFLKSSDDGDEMVHAVTDISTLSQTVKTAETSRQSSAPEPRTKREISDISDADSDRTSTAAPSPTSQTHFGKEFPPSPPTIVDREYASDSGDEAEPDSPRRGRKKDAGGDDRSSDRKKSKRRGSGKRASGQAEVKTVQDTEESSHRVPSGRDVGYDDGEDLDEDEAVDSSETPTLRPSKRRTNGKKTHPPPDCVIS